jgi:urease accessory protein
MNARPIRVLLAACAVAAMTAEPAAAHHVMGGKMPATFAQGLLSGLGHPIIGLDHLAAVVAVGCLAAAHRAGALLAVAFVAAMMLGAAVHIGAVTVPAVEAMVAVSVLVLGAATVMRRRVPMAAALVLFGVAGALHGYALAESIVGAEPAPFYAYFLGLGFIQSAIALGVMAAVRAIVAHAPLREDTVRLAGAAIAGIGIAVLVQQIVPAA